MRGPSMICRGLSAFCLASSTSPSTYWEIPLIKACSSRFVTSKSRHETCFTAISPPPFFMASARAFSRLVNSSITSVASSVLLNTKFSHAILMSGSTSERASISWAFTMPTSIPDSMIACCKNTEWIDSRTFVTPRNPNDKFEMPPLTLTYGHTSLMVLVALIKSTP